MSLSDGIEKKAEKDIASSTYPIVNKTSIEDLSGPFLWKVEYIGFDHPQYFQGASAHPYRYKQVGVGINPKCSVNDCFEYAAQKESFSEIILADFEKYDKHDCLSKFWNNLNDIYESILKEQVGFDPQNTDLRFYSVLKWEFAND